MLTLPVSEKSESRAPCAATKAAQSEGRAVDAADAARDKATQVRFSDDCLRSSADSEDVCTHHAAHRASDGQQGAREVLISQSFASPREAGREEKGKKLSRKREEQVSGGS